LRVVFDGHAIDQHRFAAKEIVIEERPSVFVRHHYHVGKISGVWTIRGAHTGIGLVRVATATAKLSRYVDRLALLFHVYFLEPSGFAGPTDSLEFG
jgi:hypothetical protein